MEINILNRLLIFYKVSASRASQCRVIPRRATSQGNFPVKALTARRLPRLRCTPLPGSGDSLKRAKRLCAREVAMGLPGCIPIAVGWAALPLNSDSFWAEKL